MSLHLPLIRRAELAFSVMRSNIELIPLLQFAFIGGLIIAAIALCKGCWGRIKRACPCCPKDEEAEDGKKKKKVDFIFFSSFAAIFFFFMVL